MKENVLCFPADSLDQVGLPNGWSSDVKTYYLDVMTKKGSLVFIDRELAESDPSYKQIIPYHVIMSDDKFFVYRRGKKGGENRLHSKLSIGIGGHINDSDVGLDETGVITYARGALREIEEEVFISSGYTNDTLGVIYDDSNDVGKVHFGIVHLIRPVIKEGVTVRDESLDFVGWMTKDDIINNIEDFETWSQIAIKNLNI